MVVRRSPFSDNPQVGVRGQRTGQRILHAARDVLGRTGYHRCSVELIAREAGCSRPTFYQYFADKEAAFAQLATLVADDLQRVASSLGTVGADAAGWTALRAWVDAYAVVYDEHEAVFHNFAVAAESDVEIARQLRRGAGHHRQAIRAQIIEPDVSAAQLDAIIDVATPMLVRVLDDASTLRRTSAGKASPATRDNGADMSGPRSDLLDSYVDVVHRTLFGLIPDVNVHDHLVRATSDRRRFPDESNTAIDGTTRRSLLAAARQVLTDVGFHGATIDAIVERAGVAHGTFYRYFPNKEMLTRELVKDASDKLSVFFAELASILSAPGSDGAELRGWLERYSQAQLDEMSILRVWSEAALVDSNLLVDAAPMLEWGRRRVAKPLEKRGFTGEQVDAMVLVALIDSLGSAARPASAIEAAALIIERGFLDIRLDLEGGGNAISV